MSGWFMHHPGLKRDEVYPGDLRELANWGLRRTSYTSRGDEKFDVTGNGRQLLRVDEGAGGRAVEQVEAEVRRLLDADARSSSITLERTTVGRRRCGT